MVQEFIPLCFSEHPSSSHTNHIATKYTDYLNITILFTRIYFVAEVLWCHQKFGKSSLIYNEMQWIATVIQTTIAISDSGKKQIQFKLFVRSFHSIELCLFIWIRCCQVSLQFWHNEFVLNFCSSVSFRWMRMSLNI